MSILPGPYTIWLYFILLDGCGIIYKHATIYAIVTKWIFESFQFLPTAQRHFSDSLVPTRMYFYFYFYGIDF